MYVRLAMFGELFAECGNHRGAAGLVQGTDAECGNHRRAAGLVQGTDASVYLINTGRSADPEDQWRTSWRTLRWQKE